jgi:hypothetical protein
VLVGRAHDQRAEVTHFLVEQADRIAFGIVATKAVRADHFGEAVSFVRRGRIAATAHFAEADMEASLGQLPRCLAAGEAATDNLNIETHMGLLVRCRRAIQSQSNVGTVPWLAGF